MAYKWVIQACGKKIGIKMYIHFYKLQRKALNDILTFFFPPGTKNC